MKLLEVAPNFVNHNYTLIESVAKNTHVKSDLSIFLGSLNSLTSGQKRTNFPHFSTHTSWQVFQQVNISAEYA